MASEEAEEKENYKMKTISMAWTSPALLAGRKTVTRRAWDHAYARRFRKGDIVAAYDRSPRSGGKKIAEIELVMDPYLEPLAAMPSSDFEAEGFKYLNEEKIKPPRSSGFTDFGWQDFTSWRRSGGEMWVVRFRVVKIGGDA